ncbi:MAG: magnesium transporter CorA family protein [Candidatus Saccharimonadales bacterium]
MVRYYVKRSQGEEFIQVDSPPRHEVWVDASNLHDQELDYLIDMYGLDRNIVYDVRDHHELPRVEFTEKDDAYIFLRMPVLGRSGRVTTYPLLVVVRPDQFFTLSLGNTVPLDHIKLTSELSREPQPVGLLLSVVISCVMNFDELLKHTERSINDTGNRLRTHEVTNHDFIHFVTVEDNLTTYRMNLGGIKAVMQRLKDTKHDAIPESVTEELDDIGLQIQQLLVAVESYGGRVESIRNAYSTIANNTLNMRMKTLTVFTVLITLPNVFYGMYGMNIALPFMKETWAFTAVVGFTVTLIIFVYLVAKRLRIF